MTTSLDRRSLLAGSLVLGAGSLALPRIAFAQGAGSRNLLFVLLRGAADGLAMLAPVGDPGFEALRGASLADYENAPRIGSFFAVHPALAEIAKSAQAGEALFVHAAATAYRERSHFDGQNLIETGGTAPYATKDGWLNRLAGLMNEGAPAPLRLLRMRSVRSPGCLSLLAPACGRILRRFFRRPRPSLPPQDGPHPRLELAHQVFGFFFEFHIGVAD
mgnify:CR=1 FL=1